MSGRELKHWIGIAASVVPQIVLIGVLISVWIEPMAWDDGRWVAHGVVIIVAEFFVLHSGVFMAGIATEAEARKRLGSFAVLLLIYGSIIAGISYSAGSTDLLWFFGSVMLGRFITLMVAVDEGAAHLGERSLYGTVLYIVLVPLSIFLPVPQLGIDPWIARDAFPDAEGVWTREPERGFAMAIVYFSIMAALETFWFGRSDESEPEIDWNQPNS